MVKLLLLAGVGAGLAYAIHFQRFDVSQAMLILSVAGAFVLAVIYAILRDA